MVKTSRSMVFAAVLCLSVTLLTSCVPLVVGAAAGAGGVAYIKGTLTRNLDVPIDRMHKMSLDALKRLRMTIQEEHVDGLTSIIRARDVDGTKVKVTVQKLTENSSKLNIRVGLLGDQTKSQMILNAIQKKL